MNDHHHAPGAEYMRDSTGTIHQIDPKPYTYDAAYIERTYGTIPRERLNETAFLRLGVLLGRCHGPATRLLDWGYGCGAFLRAAATHPRFRAFGFELNGLPVPDCATFCGDPMDHTWDVVTFYDVLEHISDLSFLRHLKAETIVVTVPWCHANEKGWEWFNSWKHRKPDEHLHHWGARPLVSTLNALGWSAGYVDAPEDCTRRGLDSPNILTAVAHRV